MRWLFFALLASSMCGVSVAEDDFVIGDEYTLEISVQESKREFSGPVVGKNEDWIAMRFTTTEMEVRQFQPEPIKYQVTHTLWIPREAIAKLSNHHPHAGEWSEAPLAFPDADDEVTIQTVGQEAFVAPILGKVQSIEGDTIHVRRKQVKAEVSKVPVLSDVPLIGGFFTKINVEEQEDDDTIRRADVQFIAIGKSRTTPLMATAVGEERK